MKKILIMSALLMSQVALTGCDSREKDTLSFEVSYTSVDGATNGFKMDCKHTQQGCNKKFIINTPTGDEKILVGIVNEPTEENYQEAMNKLQNKTMKEVEAGALVLSNYNQRLFISGGMKFKGVKDVKKWKPGSKRKENYDLITKDGTKTGSIEVKVF